MNATATNKSCPVSPFAIEMDHPQNADMLVQSIEGLLRLRSRISPNRTVTDAKSGEEYLPADRAAHLGKYGEIPGMQLHIHPKDCKYRIIDPLCDRKDILSRIQRQMTRDRTYRVDRELRGVPQQDGELDVHRMKTLCREVFHMIKIGHARLIKGDAPKLEDINNLDGRYLVNPSGIIQTTMPRYEDEMEEWKNSLSRTGG